MVAWESGRVPVSVNSSDTAFNNVETTGGAKTHTLTVNEMPSHNHSIKKQRGTNKAANGSSVFHGYWEGLDPNNGTISSESAGSSFSHNNLQPYITCYMFKRTA